MSGRPRWDERVGEEGKRAYGNAKVLFGHVKGEVKVVLAVTLAETVIVKEIGAVTMNERTKGKTVGETKRSVSTGMLFQHPTWRR